MQALHRLVTIPTLALIAFAQEPVQARDLPVQGGPGGGRFRLACDNNFFLIGISLRSGGHVDAIRAKCLAFNATKHVFVTPTRNTNFAGGAGGALRENGCSPDRYVSGIKYGFTRDDNRPKYLDYVELTCSVISGYGGDTRVCLHTGNGCWDRHPNPGPYNGWGLSFQSRCNRNEAAVGIHGRSGIYVDALALICGPKPVAAKPPGTASPGTTPRPGSGTPQPGPTTPTPTLTAEQQAILNAHNRHRDKHCAPRMTWSAQLAANAQAWASQCRQKGGGFCHQNDCGTRTAEGENLSFGWRESNGRPLMPGRTADQAVDAWYCEIAAYDFNNPRLVGGTTSGCTPVNGHFTQVVWRASTQVGCAQATCSISTSSGPKQGTLWVCRYAPAGNNSATLAQNVQRVCR
jgi:uncharacterized protein YkwD